MVTLNYDLHPITILTCTSYVMVSLNSNASLLYDPTTIRLWHCHANMSSSYKNKKYVLAHNYAHFSVSFSTSLMHIFKQIVVGSYYDLLLHFILLYIPLKIYFPSTLFGQISHQSHACTIFISLYVQIYIPSLNCTKALCYLFSYPNPT